MVASATAPIHAQPMQALAPHEWRGACGAPGEERGLTGSEGSIMANDILEILTEDHRRVEGILKTLENERDPDECLSLLNDLSLELVPHMRGEERVLYPRVQQEPAGGAIEDEAEEHHAMAEELLGELVGMALTAGNGAMEGFGDKLEQLTAALEEHIAFEEGEMFALCRESFSDEQLARFAADYEDIRVEVQGTIEQVAAGAPFEEPSAEGPQPSA